MFVTTHTLVAMTLTVTTGNPGVYVPAAVANHPLLDMFPHFGFPPKKYPGIQKRLSWYLVAGDAVIGTTLFFLVLAKTGVPFWLLFGVCLLAGWPDLLSLYHNNFDSKFAPKFQKTHEKIQNESPWYIFVELAVLLACIILIWHL